MGKSQVPDVNLVIPDSLHLISSIGESKDLDGVWQWIGVEDGNGKKYFLRYRKTKGSWLYIDVVEMEERERIEPLIGDTLPFLIAQFGCPHSDVDMNALNNPNFKWKRRKPFERGVQATVTAGKMCDVYHVLGDWTGQQVVNVSDEEVLAAAIRDDINSGRMVFENNDDRIFEMKSIAGNHISKFHAQSKNDQAKVNSQMSYGLYEKAVQKTIDGFPVKSDLKVYRDTDSNYDFEWESYYYIKGNNLFFFLSDRNDVDAPWGKKNSLDDNGKPLGGGHPAGAIRKSSLDFFVDVAIKHADKNIFLHTHQGLPNTVVGTSTKINGWRGHNDKPFATKKWKGTIGALVSPEIVNEGEIMIEQNDSIFNLIFTQWDQFVVGCANTHTHAPVNYKADPFFTGGVNEDAHSVNNDHYYWLNKSFVMNVGNLTRNHGHYEVRKSVMHPHGSIWEFMPKSDSMIAHKLIVEDAIIFKTNYRAKAGDLYQPDEKKYKLKYPFIPHFAGEDPIKPDPVSNLKIELTTDSIQISFNGTADAFAVISSDSPIIFSPESYDSEKINHSGKTYVPTYKVTDDECPNCEILRFQGTANRISFPRKFDHRIWSNKGEENILKLSHRYFKVFALNGGNGKVVYSDGVEQDVEIE